MMSLGVSIAAWQTAVCLGLAALGLVCGVAAVAAREGPWKQAAVISTVLASACAVGFARSAGGHTTATRLALGVALAIAITLILRFQVAPLLFGRRQ